MSSEILYHPANLSAILGVLCFGLAANSLSSVIWFKQVRAKSGSFFLCCLSVADALFCLTQGVMMGKLLTKQPSSCQDAILSLVIAVFANFSRLITVVVVIQRWLAISRPLSMVRWCSYQRQILVLVLCFLLMGLGFFSFETYGTWVYYKLCNAESDSQIPEHALYVDLWTASHFLYLVWHVLFIALIIVFNSLLLRATCTLPQVQGNHADTRSWHRDMQLRITILVLCLSSFSLLDASLLFVRTLQATGVVDLGTGASILEIVYNWIYVLNNSVDFVFYSCLGRDFRRVLVSFCTKAAPLASATVATPPSL